MKNIWRVAGLDRKTAGGEKQITPNTEFDRLEGASSIPKVA
jgi:hypothetical protein